MWDGGGQVAECLRCAGRVSELLTPGEAAAWFRRSPTWVRQQRDLLRLGPKYQLYHRAACRAFVLARMLGLTGADARRLQVLALAAACGLRVSLVADDGKRVCQFQTLLVERPPDDDPRQVEVGEMAEILEIGNAAAGDHRQG